MSWIRSGLHLIPYELDQVVRLARFRERYLDVIVGDGGFGTWLSRDLPVLDAAVRLLEEDFAVVTDEICEETGFGLETVARALDALDGPYITDLVKPMGSAASGNLRRSPSRPGAR